MIKNELSARETTLLRYALADGAAFCQHGKDVFLFSVPLWSEGKRAGTEKIWARYQGISEGNVVNEILTAEKEE